MRGVPAGGASAPLAPVALIVTAALDAALQRRPEASPVALSYVRRCVAFGARVGPYEPPTGKLKGEGGEASVRRFSRSVGVSRRTLCRALRSEGLPAPSHLIRWGQVMAALYDWMASPATLHEVADRHGWPDGFALSNACKRLMGSAPVHLVGRTRATEALAFPPVSWGRQFFQRQSPPARKYLAPKGTIPPVVPTLVRG